MKQKQRHFWRCAALTLLVSLLTAATAWADTYPEYITDIAVVGGTDSEAKAAAKYYQDLGYTVDWGDLNRGCGSSTDFIYLCYKKSSRANPNGGYITNIIITNQSGCPADKTFNGKTYHCAPYRGGDWFQNSVYGDLNSHAGGWDIHVYYTKEEFDDHRVVSDISFTFDEKSYSSNTPKWNDNSSDYYADLNAGAGGNFIYMHVTKTTKVNRPEYDPKFANLVYNGQPQRLLSDNPKNNCTMWYRVDGGQWDSSTASVTATTAGRHTVEYYAGANKFGNQGNTFTKTVTIGQASNSYTTTPSAKTGLTYTGGIKTLVNAGTANFGSIMYKVGSGSYSTDLPTATAANTYTVYYKVSGTSNYLPIEEKSFTVTIGKATNGWRSRPSAYSRTYTGSAQTLAYAGTANFGTVYYKLSTSSTWSTSVPTATTAGTYYVDYKVDGTSNYSGLSGRLTCTIGQATDTWTTTPSAKSLTYTGSALTLANAGAAKFGTVYYKLSTSSTWSTSVPTATTAGTYYVDYKVDGTSNYSGLSGQLTCTIGRATNSYTTAPSAKSLTYTGSALTLVNAGAAKGGTVLYKLGADGTYSANVPAQTTAGSYTIYYKVEATTNYQAIADRSLIVTIAPATNTWTTAPSAKSLTYTGSALTLANAGTAQFGTVYYKLNTSSTWSTSIPTATTVGTYYVDYKVDGTSNYSVLSGRLTCAIGQATNTWTTAPSAKSLTYTGSAQTLINAGEATDGTVLYKLGADGTYSTELPVATAAGNYTVYYKVEATTNYAAIAERQLTVSINLWGGSGTEDDPYIIASTAGLDLLAEKVEANNSYYGKYFQLGADITYDKTVENNYRPIGVDGTFAGSFDGKGHTVSGININSSDERIGLFGSCDVGVIQNVTVTNSTFVTTGEFAGGIVGYNGNVVNCHVGSDVTVGSDGNTGGIVGWSFGSIQGCTSAAVIASTTGRRGGIAGGTNGGTMSDCLYLGEAFGDGNRYVGAIMGCYWSGTTVSNYYTADMAAVDGGNFNGCIPAKVSDTKPVNIGDEVKTYGDGRSKGITVYENGLAYGGKFYVAALYTLSLADGITTTATPAQTGPDGTKFYYRGTVIPLTSNVVSEYVRVNNYAVNGEAIEGNSFKMPSADAIVTASLDDLWGMLAGADGSAEHPYIITTTAGLDLLSQKVNAGNDYADTYFQLGANITYDKTVENNFSAIGNNDHPFMGSFDGKEWTISGINISKASTYYQGLFGNLGSSAVVKNVRLANAAIAGYDYVGGIAGMTENCRIEDCSVASDVEVIATQASTYYHGGIAGRGDNVVFSGCTSSAKITASGERGYQSFGGIVGRLNGGTVSNCTSSAELAVSNSSCRDFGGIVGRLNGGTVSNCTSSAELTISNSSDCNYFGGIVGILNGGTVSNCTSSAELTVSNSSDCEYFGGIVGLASNGTDLSGCTSSARLMASECTECSSFGGVAGRSYAAVSDNFVVGAEIPVSSESGAVFGYVGGTVSNNYYLDCTVGGVAHAVNVGYCYGDIVRNNGVVSLHTITPGEGVTIVTSATKTYNGTEYYAKGTSVQLGYGTLPENGQLTYAVNGESIEGNSFTMPSADVTVTATVTVVESYSLISLDNHIVFYDDDGDVITQAEAGQRVYVSFDFESDEDMSEFMSGHEGSKPVLRTNVEGLDVTMMDSFIGYFTMPEQPVTVTVEWEEMAPYIVDLTGNRPTEVDERQFNFMPVLMGMMGYCSVMDLSTRETVSVVDYLMRMMAEDADDEDTEDEAEDEARFAFIFDLNLDGLDDVALLPTSALESSSEEGMLAFINPEGVEKLSSNYTFLWSSMSSIYPPQMLNVMSSMAPNLGITFKFDDEFENEELDCLLPLADNSENNEQFVTSVVRLWRSSVIDRPRVAIDGDDDNVAVIERPVDGRIVAGDAVLVPVVASPTFSVVLKDRTLWCDGDWNTLCLPFDVDLNDKDCPLANATARTLESASLSDDGIHLVLNFGQPVKKLEAGVPYIIKWESSANNIVNPVFKNVAIDFDYNIFYSDDDRVQFRGNWEKLTFAEERQNILMLGAENQLFWPDGTAPSTLGACRAHFFLPEPGVCAAQIRSFELNFEGESETAIANLKPEHDDDSCYTLDGRKVNQPGKGGITILRGKKVLNK